MTIPVTDGYAALREPYTTMWRAARTIDDLNRLTQEYLDGKLPLTPWSMAEFHEDSYVIRKWLQTINQSGFTVVRAQPGMLGFGKQAQRALISGFVANNRAGALSDELRLAVKYRWTNNLHFTRAKKYTLPFGTDTLGETRFWAAKTNELTPLSEVTYAGFMDPDLLASLDDEVVHFQISDDSWGANDLFPDFIRILKDVIL